MLQQILKDMYVDPDILAELDEQQKQTLFCKMREEQVRRWKSWTEKLGNNANQPSIKSAKKSVRFLTGIDDEPWVWVMGEHPDDKTIDEILKGEAMEKARAIAEREAEEMRKEMEAQLAGYIEDDEPSNNKIEDIYCSVDELRAKSHTFNINNNYTLNDYENNKINNKLESSRDILQEISLNTQKVAQRVALWEKRLTEERTCEILKNIQKKQQEVTREAEEDEIKQDQLWREQERKAKQAELQIREIARRARAEHRLTSDFEIDSSYCTVSNSGVPPGRLAVLDWYKSGEFSRFSGRSSENRFENWFHGLITRSEAERLLLDCNYGTFLVRLSEKIWGYAISYRAKEKCKHYLVSASPNQKYQFLGNNQIEHNSLRDLIEYHKVNPLSGGETLMDACPRDSSSSIDELLD